MLHYLRESPSPLSLCSGPLCGHVRNEATAMALYYLYTATKTDDRCIHQASSHSPAISMLREAADLNDGIAESAVNDFEVVLFGAQHGALSSLAEGVSQRISNQLQGIFEGASVEDPSGDSAATLAACVVGG
ncbi:unnamed protein product [Prorocentrum cordatum]|uniref:Uncharacterized protein n=1 Tax=Prorocentrum cordatum TaxID=2364126 RepID=A0ABN9UEL4_9DINO|nr:unnamed protein product [Polarella glacialis]